MTSRKQLDALCDELNKALQRPTTYYDFDSRGCQIGHLSVYKSHFGYEVHEVVNEGGGVRNVGVSEGMTAREVKCLLRGLLEGATLSSRAVR